MTRKYNYNRQNIALKRMINVIEIYAKRNKISLKTQ